MRIAIVGGVERNEGAYREIAEAAGHVLSFHSGHVGGRGSATLSQMVRGADLLLVVTDVNSPGAVQLARRLGRKEGVPVVLQRRCSPSRFAALVSAAPPLAA
jgi:ribosome-interacting GTPase 1